jgi:hypothetical protein
MKIHLARAYSGTEGFALALTVVFGALSLMILASAMTWSANTMRLNARNNQYFRTVAGAEAATEAVISRLDADFQASGDALVQTNLNSYRQIVPTPSQNSYWAGYIFGNDLGQTGQTQVVFFPPNQFRELSSQYRGLNGYASSYHVISDARETSGSFGIVAGVEQDVETATIPLFQFAIFYNMDLEICPGPNMTISGPVHSNGILYSQPQAVLTYQNDVTAVGSIIHDKKPGDPTIRTFGSITYMGEHDGGVNSLNLPIGTNNSPAAVRQVVEKPPTGELATSAMGKQRYYNQADMVITVTDSGVTATSGLVDNFGTTIPKAQVSSFVDTTVTFFNKRENDTIKTTQIDVAKLRQWNGTNKVLRPILPFADVRIVYVNDQRTLSGSTGSGVRLVNGDTILPQGLTVATPNPLYVLGNYNVPAAARGTSDTSQTLPASLVADAITILSPTWTDANSSKSLANRLATSTTVNAAFLAGIVETVSGSYSGGVENFPRFLEDWSNATFTYNGSMVVMFDSLYATGLWRGTGTSFDIYNPPTRNWNFDTNFQNPAKIPPGTPSARVVIRGTWTAITPKYPLN